MFPPKDRSHAYLRPLLLGGSALCGVAAVFVGVATRAANILPTQGAVNLAVPTPAGSLVAKTLVGGVVTPGTISYASSGAAATVALSASRTLIDWTTFEVGAGNTLTFNFVNNSDIVLNRVAGGSISVDAGGTVNGTYGPGSTGGNLWFIAPNGVFLHGTVSASGVLATNNAALADLNLLSDNVTTLKAELAAAGSLFDFEGTVTATDASIDASGNLVLNGDVDTGPAGTVALVSTGAITQTGGVITATALTGTSVGATQLTDQNLFDTLTSFNNTGSGGVSIVDAQPTGLTVTGAVTVAPGTTLSLITTDGPLTISASQVVSGGALNLSSATVLAINAPVTVEGATAVSLGYNSDSPTNSLSFGNGASLTYANADGTPATSSQGGTLTINDQPYTLLYKLALPGSTGPDAGLDDIAGIDANSEAGGDEGAYALAVNVAGTGTPGSPQFTGPLAGAGGNIFSGSFNGLGHTITNVTINDASDNYVGLFGQSGGFISNVGLVGGSLTANASANGDGGSVFAGGLIGLSSGSVIDAYASAAVTGTGGGGSGGVVGIGGLVGGNNGEITQSYATGPVANTGGGAATVFVGGLAGSTNGGSLTAVYATGSVTGVSPNLAGGLVGYNNSAITQAYATGNVFGPVIGGGLVGYNDTGGTVSAAAFDAQTTGQGLGINQNFNPDGASAAYMTTAQLQTGGLPSGFDPTVWSGGTGGLYPFLTAAYPSGVQAVSGTIGGLVGTGAYSIGLIGGGTDIAVATAGADNTYYVIAPAGTLTAGESLLAYSARATFSAATLSPATGATTQPGLNVYAPALTVPTSATTLSTAPTLAQAQALALAAAGSNVVAQNDITNAAGLGLLATGPSFTVDQPVTANTFGVLTEPGAPLTVAAPIVITNDGELGLLSGGVLTIDAPVSLRGAGLVALTYDASLPTNLSFGAGGAVTFANADGSPATSSQGGLLTINDRSYFLLYNLALPGSTGPDTGIDDIAGIDANELAGGDAGFYALATNLTGTGSPGSPQFVSPLAGQAASYFTGAFEGLGHTVTNLTINNPVNGEDTGAEATGLFGYSSGVIRDIGVVGGSVVGATNASVGEVVGASYGTVVAAYATGSVSAGANSNIGVTVGYNDGTVAQSYATGSVSGGGANSAIGGLVGGQAAEGSIIQSYAAGAVSGGGTLSDVGGLVGNTMGSVAQSNATGTVSETGLNSVIGGLAGNNGGSISGSYATGAVTDALGGQVGGLVGQNDASSAITVSYATGTVTGAANSSVGGLVGFNDGQIGQSYYIGVVSDLGSADVGGLVGDNDTTGAITQSSATGMLTAGANAVAGGLAGYNTGVITLAMAQVAVEDSQSGSQLGGLVGYNDVAGSLNFTLATGPVNGDPSSDVGGLVGHNLGAIYNGLATGAVSGGLVAGGLVGHNDTAGTINFSAYDTLTSGQTNSIGLDSNPTGQSGNIEAANTTQLQTAGLPPGFSVDVWSGGTNGLYPYLNVLFPNGLQAVSGFAYSDAGLTPLASGVDGPVRLGLVGAGVYLGGTFTGANGYYYGAAPAGSLAAGEGLLIYIAPGAPGAATLSTATGAPNQSGLNLYGGAVTVPTTAVTLSTAPTLAQAQTLALAAAGGDTDAQAAIQAAAGLGLVAQGPNFTVDQSVTTSNTLVIQTGSAAALTVAAPISVNTGGSLGLLSGGPLAINAPVAANGAIGVNLAYDASQPTNLSFGAGAALTFATADGGPATSSQGGYLSINGQAYTLLYNLAQPGSTGPDTGLDDIAGIDANAPAGGDAGSYALATDVAGTGAPGAPQFTSALVGAGDRAFTGMFEGLGHTVTDLTISDLTNTYVGLFGGAFGATVRDIGLVGGSVNGRAAAAVGALIGDNEGLMVNAYSGAAVTDGRAFSYAGGLAGENGGTILDSFATGAVTGGANGEAGGLVGDSGGSIIQAFATGAVTVGMNGEAGGLLGAGDGSISQGYATGAVSGGPGATIGGLVGVVELSATVTGGAFDSVTTGQSSAFGSNADPDGTSAVALTTAQFQSGNLPPGFSPTAWGAGPGLYPYLTSAFPGGVQAVSGIAYSDSGATPLPSGASGAVTVGLTANGAPVGTATTGANGYYYIFAPAGTLTAGESLVAATIAGAPVESSTYTATGAVAQTSVNIYGPAPGSVLPTQGAVNLATPTDDGSLATNILVGGVETPGIAGYVSTGPTATVTLTAPRTLIDWTTFEVGAGDTLDFNFTGSASDIVLNRVVGGAITVDTGGQVNGFYNGAPGGNIWFLSPAGVFIHGSVTAGGVLASNNTSLPDLNLLSDSLSTLKAELATDASLIDLTGAVTVTGASIDGSGNIVLGGDVDASPAGAVNLVSIGTISQTGGVITASTLDSASSGSTTLTDQNQVATLGSSNSGPGTFAFTDAIATGLTIGGTISATAGDVDITATGPGATLTLAASLNTDSAHAVNLVSAGPIVQTTSIITTGSFSGSSVGGATLFGDNAVNTLGGFTNAGAGDVNISDFQPTGLTVTGAIDAGAGNNFGLGNDLGGTLTLAANITAGGTVSLGSVGPIAQISGVITAGALTGGSAGGASFTGANQFGALSGFTNTSGGNLAVVDAFAAGLMVTGAVNAGAGNILSLTTTGGPITLAASLFSPSGVVDLSSASAINQTGGVIVAATLNSAANGPALLTGPNQVVSLGGFTNGGAGTLAFTDAIAAGLTITSSIASGAGDIDLTTTAPGAALTLAADLTTDPTHGVALVSAGPIEQASGVITTSTVSGSSVGGTSLTGANLFSNLGPFANVDASDVTIVDTLPSGLTVTGAVDAGAGNTLNLTTTSGPLTLAADISASGGAITLTSAASIGQTAGIITTGTLTGTSRGGATLTDANQIASLASFANADSGAISVTDAQSLAITGTVDNTRVVGTPGIGRDIAIDVTAGNLTASAAITAAGDVAIQAVGGSMSLSTVSSGDDVVLAAGQGAVSLGGTVSAVGTAASGAAQALFNTISGRLDDLFTLSNQSLFIEAKTFNNAAGSPLTAGAAIGIALSDPGGLYLANANPGVGSWVRPATLLAPSVTLFERVGNLNVAAATIGGPINSLNLYAANFVQVTGVFRASRRQHRQPDHRQPDRPRLGPLTDRRRQ